MENVGKVYLVGAGPGDVGLITVKGMEMIGKADVILYDRLVNPLLLEYSKPKVELIYCGKLPDRHILRQENINELLVTKAAQGNVVVRLKGGDPSVFGRVGEEAEALAQHGLPFEIVPGITSGIAASAYAGIPVTHREYGSTFAMVTGHDKSKEGKPTINWEALAKGIDTIAFYMGIGNLPHISEKLIEFGKSPKTPVILIQWGTTNRQKTLEGTLETIAALAKKENFSNPAITLVGEIVQLREKIKWFDKQLLSGQQILVARTGEEKGRLAKALMDKGADVLEYPRIHCRSLQTESEFGKIVKEIDLYERILFLSPDSVRFFFEGIRHYGIDVRSIKADLYGGSIKSKNALEEKGFIAKTIDGLDDEGKLLVVSDSSLVLKQSELTGRIGPFDMLLAFEKEEVAQSHATLRRTLEEGKLDKVVFPSAASVEQLLLSLEKNSLDSKALLSNVEIICMGERSANAVEKAGYTVKAIPHEPTVAGLLKVLGYEGKDIVNV